jgi:hypothetical protein
VAVVVAVVVIDGGGKRKEGGKRVGLGGILRWWLGLTKR